MSKWKRKWKVPRSSGEGTWIVSQAEDGSWGCSCPRWIFHREQCHHIQAVQTNPQPYSADQPCQLPEIVPGHVEAVAIVDGLCLHPLIPLDGHGTDVLATIAYDLVRLGYSWGIIKQRFQMIPREWTMRAVKGHVEKYGRILCQTVECPSAFGGFTTQYVFVPRTEG